MSSNVFFPLAVREDSYRLELPQHPSFFPRYKRKALSGFSGAVLAGRVVIVASLERLVNPKTQWIFQVPVKGGRDYITP